MKAYPEPANKLETGMAWTGTKRNLTAIQLEVTRRVIAISQRLCEKQTEQQLNLTKTKRWYGVPQSMTVRTILCKCGDEIGGDVECGWCEQEQFHLQMIR